MATYTEDPDERRLPCPDPDCPFVATGKDAQRDLTRHIRAVHERSS